MTKVANDPQEVQPTKRRKPPKLGVLSDDHRQLLLESACSPEVLADAVDRGWLASSGPHTWTDPESGDTIDLGACLWFNRGDDVDSGLWARRYDNPPKDENGRPGKYLSDKGAPIGFKRMRDGDPDTFTAVAFVEGDKQGYAAASWLPAHVAVYVFFGIHNTARGDFKPFKDRPVYLFPDADQATNPQVWDGVKVLRDRLAREGAGKFHLVRTSGEGKDGLDDVLKVIPAADRTERLKTWMSTATDKLGRRPKVTDEAKYGDTSLYRTDDRGAVSFQPRTAAYRVLGMTEDENGNAVPAPDAKPEDVRHLAVSVEGNVAMYVDGVYDVTGEAFTRYALRAMGDRYRSADLDAWKFHLVNILKGLGLTLKQFTDEPVANFRNCMVDLRTGATMPHDPKYMSWHQSPLDYLPGMATPFYDAWIMDKLRPVGCTDDARVAAIRTSLEEISGALFDKSKTPGKSLFLFGPSRSGKSEFLHKLTVAAGDGATSAVTLHQLADDVFAAANLYGAALNVAADLSSAHVQDLSAFKMLTGDDPINANRKYGQQFKFKNAALFAFSANQVPTVSETSRAYFERMIPVEFPNTFAGAEDHSVRDKLMAELPGIVARWVKAYSSKVARGTWAPLDADTKLKFEAKSDRVTQFVLDEFEIQPVPAGHTPNTSLGKGNCTSRMDVYKAFVEASKDAGGRSAVMKRAEFFDRVERVSGVVAIRADKGARAGSSYNLVPKDFDVPAPTGVAGMAAALAADEQAQPVAVPDELAAAVEDAFDCAESGDWGDELTLTVPSARVIALKDAPKRGIRLVDVDEPTQTDLFAADEQPKVADPFAVGGLGYEF